jgi:uncharacterized protein with NRDE domain
MCTLIALHRHVPNSPLLIAANRDEYLDRPSEGPALREALKVLKARDHGSGSRPGTHSSGTILAPLDLRAGGTWLGINASGVFTAVTNRRTDAPDPALRSRGMLVMEVLSISTAEEAAGRIDLLPADAYNPFNLLIADDHSAHLLTYGRSPERVDLAPGAHVIGNVHPMEESPKVARIRQETLEVAEGPEDGMLDRMAALCRSHEGSDALAATCVHAGGYGTRSSTLLRTGASPELRYASGAPCTHPYDDFTPSLRMLLETRA